MIILTIQLFFALRFPIRLYAPQPQPRHVVNLLTQHYTPENYFAAL